MIWARANHVHLVWSIIAARRQSANREANSQQRIGFCTVIVKLSGIDSSASWQRYLLQLVQIYGCLGSVASKAHYLASSTNSPPLRFSPAGYDYPEGNVLVINHAQITNGSTPANQQPQAHRYLPVASSTYLALGCTQALLAPATSVATCPSKVCEFRRQLGRRGWH